MALKEAVVDWMVRMQRLNVCELLYQTDHRVNHALRVWKMVFL